MLMDNLTEFVQCLTGVISRFGSLLLYDSVCHKLRCVGVCIWCGSDIHICCLLVSTTQKWGVKAGKTMGELLNFVAETT